jgi:hypothetical protein
VQKLIKTINNKENKKGLKSKICEGITMKENVAWKVAWKATLHPDPKDERNLNIIHRLQMKRSASGAHVWRMENHTTHSNNAIDDKKANCPLCHAPVEDIVHFLGDCEETKEIREKALNKICKIVDKAHGQTMSIQVWVGDDGGHKAAILLGLLPKEWAKRAQRVTTQNRKRKREESNQSTTEGASQGKHKV